MQFTTDFNERPEIETKDEIRIINYSAKSFMDSDQGSFFIRFRPLIKQASFLEAAGAVAKIGTSLIDPPLANSACLNG